LYNEGSRHEIDEDVNSVMMASENDQFKTGFRIKQDFDIRLVCGKYLTLVLFEY
jgi:hypothetical protein